MNMVFIFNTKVRRVSKLNGLFFSELSADRHFCVPSFQGCCTEVRKNIVLNFIQFVVSVIFNAQSGNVPAIEEYWYGWAMTVDDDEYTAMYFVNCSLPVQFLAISYYWARSIFFFFFWREKNGIFSPFCYYSSHTFVPIDYFLVSNIDLTHNHKLHNGLVKRKKCFLNSLERR